MHGSTYQDRVGDTERLGFGNFICVNMLMQNPGGVYNAVVSSLGD